jgi:hypothetical protein
MQPGVALATLHPTRHTRTMAPAHAIELLQIHERAVTSRIVDGRICPYDRSGFRVCIFVFL